MLPAALSAVPTAGVLSLLVWILVVILVIALILAVARRL